MIVTIYLIIAAIISVGLLIAITTELVVFVMTRVPFVPSPTKDIAELVHRLPITANDFVYDLGSGNGRVVFAIEKLSGARVKGFQLIGWTHWYAKMRKLVTKSKAHIVGGNFFKHNLSDATIVYVYLYPFLMRSIGDKVKAECKPGTRIVVRDFPVPNMPLTERWDLGDNHEIFIYTV